MHRSNTSNRKAKSIQGTSDQERIRVLHWRLSITSKTRKRSFWHISITYKEQGVLKNNKINHIIFKEKDKRLDDRCNSIESAVSWSGGLVDARHELAKLFRNQIAVIVVRKDGIWRIERTHKRDPTAFDGRNRGVPLRRKKRWRNDRCRHLSSNRRGGWISMCDRRKLQRYERGKATVLRLGLRRQLPG